MLEHSTQVLVDPSDIPKMDPDKMLKLLKDHSGDWEDRINAIRVRVLETKRDIALLWNTNPFEIC